MKKKIMSRLVLGLAALAVGQLPAAATTVKVVMNSITRTMMLVDKSNNTVDVGDPTSYTYTFDVDPGSYTLTGYGTDGTTNNGSIVIKVPDSDDTQTYTIYTVTFYATNSGFVYGTDYTADVTVAAQAGGSQDVVIGNSVTSGRKTVLVMSGDTVYLTLNPSEERVAEGYAAYSTSSTRTGNGTLSGTLPQTCYYTVVVPSAAGVEIGTKSTHYVDFTAVEPTDISDNGSEKTYTYRLGANTTYNLRTWKPGGLTYAMYFRKSSGNEEMQFTDDDYSYMNPKTVNHDPTSNSGYETGDIFLNINNRNHLEMSVGDTFDCHAMRTWQLTDTQINNYFFEPDFHYTVLDLNGNPSTGVIEISTDDTTSSWRTITAVGQGEAIVLVTYDAISCTYNGRSTAYMGGQYWGAIWPENTGVFVVSVGEPSTLIKPNLTVNEQYNVDADGNIIAKMSGINVDAEHDVFYYLDPETDTFPFTFSPEGVSTVTLAYPTIGSEMATYSGFGSTGVTGNADGSYTVQLKYGRNILKLTDIQGKSIYQVLNAKPCQREITNVTRPGSELFYPGDQVKIQYSGMFHPANKMSGIYNMSAYVTFNGVPNGTSLILSANQYTFASKASAQCVNLTIPEEFFPDGYIYTLDEGCLQVNGYGDQIGNHRNTSRTTGRSANFTATVNKSYYGSVPPVYLPIGQRKSFNVTIDCNVEDVAITIKRNGTEITPDEDGVYHVYDGTLEITPDVPANYRRYELTYEITEDMDTEITIPINLVYTEGCWDGVSTSEPEKDDNGVYQISTPAEFAWFAAWVNANNTDQDAVLVNDIDLGDFKWTPIGKNRPYFQGCFDGQKHKVEGLYVNNANYRYYDGVFSRIHGGTIKNLAVYGEVITGYNGAGIVGSTYWTSGTEDTVNIIDNCVNYANVSGNNCVGGIVGYIDVRCYDDAPYDQITNCMNAGKISATDYGNAGIVGYSSSYYGYTWGYFSLANLLNVGEIEQPTSYPNGFGACIFYENFVLDYYSNLYSLPVPSEGEDIEFADMSDTNIVTAERMASGEIAWQLGDAYGQTIGEDAHPVLWGNKVLRVDYTIITKDSETSDNSATASLYTNGVLPAQIDEYIVKWYTDEALTDMVTEIEADCTLYAIAYTHEPQEIIWEQELDTVEVGQSIELTATLTSGLDPVYEVTEGDATLEGNVLTVNAAGVVTVKAYHPGNDYYEAAEAVYKTLNATVGIATVRAADNTIVRYFNLQGIEVANPTPGQVYIEVSGKDVRKIVL